MSTIYKISQKGKVQKLCMNSLHCGACFTELDMNCDETMYKKCSVLLKLDQVHMCRHSTVTHVKQHIAHASTLIMVAQEEV